MHQDQNVRICSQVCVVIQINTVQFHYCFCLISCIILFLLPDNVSQQWPLYFQAVLFVLPSRQILLSRYLMNSLNSFFYKSDKEYSLVHTDDLIILEVKGQSYIRPSRSNLVNAISYEVLEQSR